MHKRNIGGILKYGERTYKNPTGKLQAGGGFSAYAKGYNWREDPYELMLLQNKFKQNRASTYADGLGSIGSGKGTRAGSSKITQMSDMPTLEKGLSGSRRIAQNQLDAQVHEFRSLVAANGVDWVKGYDGQVAYQQLIRNATTLNAELISEKEQFDTSLSEYKDKNGTNLDTLAISSNNSMFVIEKGVQGAKSITSSEYLTNMDKYQILTTGDFAAWKQNESGMDKRSITEYLDKGAISSGSVIESYINPHEDILQYKVIKNKLIKKGAEGEADEELGNVDKMTKGLLNKMRGQSVYQGTPTQEIGDNEALEAAARSVYSTIFKASAQGSSKLNASLMAEVLKSAENVEAMKKMGSVEERANFLQKQIAYTLLNKIINKSAIKGTKSSEGAEGGDSFSGKIDPLTGAAASLVADANSDKWKIGKGIVSEGEKRVGVVSFPVEDGLSSAELDIAQNKDSTQASKENLKINDNEMLNKFAKTDVHNMYFEDGTSVVAALGGAEAAQNWLDEDFILKNGEGAKVIWVPTQDGKPAMKEYSEFSEISLTARREYIEAMKKAGIPVKARADELLPGNMNPTKKQAYGEYKAGMSTYTQADELKAASDKDPSNYVLKQKSDIANAAKTIIENAHRNMLERVNQKPFVMKAYFMPAGYFDDDDKAFAEGFIKARKNKFGDNTVTEVNSKHAKEALQDLAGIDNWNWSWLAGDSLYKTRLLVPARQAFTIRDKDGMGLEARKAAQAIEMNNMIINKMSQVTVGANDDIRQTARFIINI